MSDQRSSSLNESWHQLRLTYLATLCLNDGEEQLLHFRRVYYTGALSMLIHLAEQLGDSEITFEDRMRVLMTVSSELKEQLGLDIPGHLGGSLATYAATSAKSSGPERPLTKAQGRAES